MKIIRKEELRNGLREDGRTVMKYFSFDVNFKIKNIGLLTTVVPLGCHEKEHAHPKSDEIFFYLTDAIAKVNSKEYELKKGDILIIHAGDKHHQIPRKNTIELIALKVPDIYDKVYTNENN